MGTKEGPGSDQETLHREETKLQRGRLIDRNVVNEAMDVFVTEGGERERARINQVRDVQKDIEPGSLRIPEFT